MFSTRRKIVFILLSTLAFVFVSCNKTKIRAVSRGANGSKPYFTMKTIAPATKTSQGQADLTLSSKFDMTINCQNCGTLGLNFQKSETPTGNGFAMTARFGFPMVDRTYICKAQLKVTFTETKAVNDYVYGIYFCPEDPQTNARVCDKAGAIERCGF